MPQMGVDIRERSAHRFEIERPKKDPLDEEESDEEAEDFEGSNAVKHAVTVRLLLRSAEPE